MAVPLEPESTGVVGRDCREEERSKTQVGRPRPDGNEMVMDVSFEQAPAHGATPFGRVREL